MEFNLAQLSEAIAEAIPERECLVWRGRRMTWSQLNQRTRRLANYLSSRGLALHQSRDSLAGWESGQDHVALYMYNCPAYLEGMLGAFKARLVPVNVNYRYVAEELTYLLRDSCARALVYQSTFAPTVAEIRAQLPELEVLIQVSDSSGRALLPGAVDYEAALAEASPERPPLEWSPDDLYILYTGGTTGFPKGVLWRQADIYPAAMGGRRPDGREPASLEEIVTRAKKGRARAMPTAPFMHAAHWAAFDTLHSGSCVVLQDVTEHLDADAILSTAARERVQVILIVGDAFGRPLLEQMRAGSYDLSALVAIVSGAAALNARVKRELLELLPAGARIIDTMGSSETGVQATDISSKDKGATTGSFRPSPGACVLSSDLSRVLAPGDEHVGWFAQSGHVPLGYLGDREKTERTFPTVGGVRYSVPGDRARWRADGAVELLGRDSVTINSGGEKIFAEEVEHAIVQHPAVYDAIVCGRPSERWGNEVVAVVKLRAGQDASREELLAECGKHLARYKLPKAIIFTDEVLRSPTGKPDYRRARDLAREGT